MSEKIAIATTLGKDRKVDLFMARFCDEALRKHGGYWFYLSSGWIEFARNEIVNIFLNQKKVDKLLWIDADTVPPVDCVEKLLSYDKDIVAGLAPMGNCKTGLAWSYQPKKNEKVGCEVKLQDRLLQVERVGGTPTLVHRRVYEEMEWEWYKSEHRRNEEYIGNDFKFCDKAIDLGFEVWCDESIRCSHINSVDLKEVADKMKVKVVEYAD